MGHGEYSPSRDSECGAGGHKARHRTHLAESLARDGGSDTTHGAQLQENTGAANQGGNQPRAHTRRERHSSGHVSIQHPREACKPPHRARHNERSPIAGSRGQRRPPQLATAGHRSPRQCGHAHNARACRQCTYERRGETARRGGASTTVQSQLQRATAWIRNCTYSPSSITHADAVVACPSEAAAHQASQFLPEIIEKKLPPRG